MSRVLHYSEGDLYHVMNRGVGHCIIFEDDADRREFLRLLTHALDDFGGTLHAWCLMDNHFHLLIEARHEYVPKIMHWIDTQYAKYFNKRYDRDGRLFGGPYKGEPIVSDEHYLTVLRYIHRNPIKAGMTTTCDYRWSSYREYLGKPRFIYADFALSLFSSVKGFRAFHEIDDPTCSSIDIDQGNAKCPLSDESALRLANSLLTDCTVESISGLSRDKRNAAIRVLRGAGLPVRQISRLTGIPKSTVVRA